MTAEAERTPFIRRILRSGLLDADLSKRLKRITLRSCQRLNSLDARDSGRGNSPSIGLLLGPALDPGLRADVAPRGASADGRSIDDRTTVAVLTSVRSSAG
jgi:hypothetical protein